MYWIKREYGQVGTFFTGGFGRMLKMTAVAFAVLMVLGFAGTFAFPDLAQSFLNRFVDQMQSSGITGTDGSIHPLALFFNNIRATFVMLLYGLIPFLYLPALALGTNAILLGVVAAGTLRNGLSPAYFFVGILPHGIFELPALIVSIALGLYLCSRITHALRFKRKGIILPTINEAMRVMILLCLPLLALAAVVEAYLTPALLHLI